MDNHLIALLRDNLTALSGIQETLDKPPLLSAIVIPEMHWQALEPDTTIVAGDRGSGKSFWTAVLYDNQCRQFIADMKRSNQLNKLKVHIGFSVDQRNRWHPNKAELKALDKDNISHESVWKAIVLRHLYNLFNEPLPTDDSWKSISQWVEKSGGGFGATLADFNDRLANEGKSVLIVFDALDRLADNWEGVRKWTTPALQMALELRSYRYIRTKFFLRTDMAEDDRLWSFQDSSKLKHNRIELTWKKMDLFSIIIRHLANSEECSELFRSFCQKERILDFDCIRGTHIEKSIKVSKEDSIREAVQAITGRYMGSGPKRGLCYSWIPVHLADAKGNSSPRSLLKTIREAAIDTQSRFPDHMLPLHYEAIKYGVARASSVRVDELKEDYPWIEPLLHSLSGQIVPIEVTMLENIWKIPMKALNIQDRLPPRRYTNDLFQAGQFSSLLDDLQELGVLYRTHDNRINIPDIYRVGHRIGRKGGVKPIR
jgi:hypothetical protein